MVSNFTVVLFLASLFGFASSMQDFFGFNAINPSTFKHVNARIHVGNGKQIIIDKYYAFAELQDLLKKLETYYPSIVKLNAIGTTKGRLPIMAVQISRGVRLARNLTKPMFKYVANIHGDEAVGYALMVSLIQYLVYSDQYNPRVTKLLNDIDIWIVPSLNPDGFRQSQMGKCASLYLFKGNRNGNNVDLDTDFPQENVQRQWHPQSETQSMMNFINNYPFVLSGNFQSGHVVASYPMDSSSISKTMYSSSSLDRDIFYGLAFDYATKNSMMKYGNACNKYFQNGVSNGAYVRNHAGGMQDYNYVNSNCFELTFYLSCCNYPHSNLLPFYWEANLESMLKFMESTRRGVYGRVWDASELDPILNAFIKVEGKGKVIAGSNRGEFWRLLNPGRYKITASAPGYLSQTHDIVVDSTQPLYHEFYLRLDSSKNRKKCYPKFC